jgi:hypothetical protein
VHTDLRADHRDTLVVRGNLAAARLAAGQAGSATTELTRFCAALLTDARGR